MDEDMEIKQYTGDSHHIPEGYIYRGTIYPGKVVPAQSITKAHQWTPSSDDVIIASFPKSGLHWISSIIALIHRGDATWLQGEESLDDVITYLEMALNKKTAGVERLHSMTPPYMVRTHLHFRYLHHQVKLTKPKVIVLLRNPKDILVSFFHHYQMSYACGNFQDSFSEFFELFKKKQLAFGDIFDWQLEWWQQRHHGNVHVIKYEDAKRNLVHVIQDLAQFLDKPLTMETTENIIKATSVKKLRDNPRVNPQYLGGFDGQVGNFVRKGEVGDWQNYFSQEQSEYVDQLCKQLYEPAGLTFDYGI